MSKRKTRQPRNKFNPNKGYYVEFYSHFKGSGGYLCDYGASAASEHSGRIRVEVYKSLYRNPPTLHFEHLEHVDKIGFFYIHNTKKKTISTFLKEVKKGIEKLACQRQAE